MMKSRLNLINFLLRFEKPLDLFGQWFPSVIVSVAVWIYVPTFM